MKSTNIILFILISFIILIKSNLPENNYKNDDEELIDISEGYTKVDPLDKSYFYVPIISTNDLHGHFYPEQLEIDGYNYTQGGIDYLSKYISILKNEFPERVLFLDTGDLFQGGTESILSDGEIMTDSLRYEVLKRDGYRCKICGVSANEGARLEVDHIIPISKGGKTVIDNLQTLCMSCNRGKSDKDFK